MSNTCKYWDCGWCYAPDNVETNADSQSACVNPSFCPQSDDELEAIARAAEIQYMKEHGGFTASTPDGIHAQLRAQRIAGLRAAADWQLEQVSEAWEQCMGSDTNLQVISRFDHMLRAMRPTTTQEDNND